MNILVCSHLCEPLVSLTDVHSCCGCSSLRHQKNCGPTSVIAGIPEIHLRRHTPEKRSRDTPQRISPATHLRETLQRGTPLIFPRKSFQRHIPEKLSRDTPQRNAPERHPSKFPRKSVQRHSPEKLSRWHPSDIPQKIPPETHPREALQRHIPEKRSRESPL